jgi:uncharacterized DUF497 family protein
MRAVIVGFDWDAANRGKCQKHGVSLDEIEALLGATPRVAGSRPGSLTEDRFIAVGRNADGRPLFVAFTIRMKGGRPLIRPIGARYMHRKEIEAYEKEGS